MKEYNLNIAGYNIRFESAANGPELIPSERFSKSIITKPDPDVLITVHSGDCNLPKGARRVFHAPLFEEDEGTLIRRSRKFWSVYKHHSRIFIKTTFPFSPTKNKGILVLSLTFMCWDLWLTGDVTEADPMEYPLDALILYYLTIIFGDVMIHASGVNNAGKGYLFSGVSGKGKTTLARLWFKTGAAVINDDRLIIRKRGAQYLMYNTPVYTNDEPRESPVSKIFIIEHASENRQVRLTGAAAVSRVMANCIQQNWNREIIARLMGTVSIMCSTVPVSQLFFRPDRRIIEYLLENE